VYIEDGCTIEHATVGPNVSLGAGSTVRHSSVVNAVIGENTLVEHAQLHDAFLGDRVVVRGVKGSMNVGDDSDIRMDA
jgi:glucose-1-phosphate thymidylyltransferase